MGAFFLAIGIMTASISNVSAAAISGHTLKMSYSNDKGADADTWSISYSGVKVATQEITWNKGWFSNRLTSHVHYYSYNRTYKALSFKAGASADGVAYVFSDWASNTNGESACSAGYTMDKKRSGTGYSVAYWK